MPRKAKNTAKTRRGNKEGSIYQRKDGTWCGQVLMGYKPDGKPKRKTFYGKTREIVAEKITNISSDNFRGVAYIEPSNITFEELLKEWLFNFKKIEVSPRTFEWYLGIAKNNIYDEIGHIHLKELKAYHIQNLLNKRHTQGISKRTLSAVKITIGQCLKHACEMNLISINPSISAKIPKSERMITEESSKVIEPKQRKILLEVLENDITMKTMITVLMFTGMRVGELLALPWKNVDFKVQTITIDRAITRDPQFDEVGTLESNNTIIATTKTYSSKRKFKVSGTVIDILTKWRKLQKNKGDNLITGDAVIFPNKHGETRTYSGFRTVYNKFLKKYGLEQYNLNLHKYRHTFATMLLEDGVNPKVVQKFLGHKTIQITLDTYSHVLSEVYTAVAETIDSIYENIKVV